MRLLIIFCFFLCACSGDGVPDGVLPPKKMQAVLYDVIRADELIDYLAFRDSTYRLFPKRTALYDSIFQLHKIGKEDYRRSMAFYQSRPDLLKEILESLRSISDAAIKRLNKDSSVSKPAIKPAHTKTP